MIFWICHQQIEHCFSVLVVFGNRETVSLRRHAIQLKAESDCSFWMFAFIWNCKVFFYHFLFCTLSNEAVWSWFVVFIAASIFTESRKNDMSFNVYSHSKTFRLFGNKCKSFTYKNRTNWETRTVLLLRFGDSFDANDACSSWTKNHHQHQQLNAMTSINTKQKRKTIIILSYKSVFGHLILSHVRY